MRGDLLALKVALAPCVIGYAEIATRLAARPNALAAANPYNVWIAEYAGVPYQEVAAPPMTPELLAACRRAMHVLTADGRTLRAGRASLFVLRETGNGRLATFLSLPPLVWLVDVAYRIVARNRSKLSWLIFPPRRA